ncbi:terminase small subunit-like protein [Sphingobium limneticum]
MAKNDGRALTVGPVRTRARASRKTEKIRQEVLQFIVAGESIRSICDREGMPCKSTVMNWIAADPEFRAGYVAAKALYAEVLAEEIIEIADDAKYDWVEGENGKELDYEHVQRSRLRVDSRKWLAARLSPKRYGDSAMLKIGEAEAAPSAANGLSQNEIAVRLAALAQSVSKQKG